MCDRALKHYHLKVVKNYLPTNEIFVSEKGTTEFKLQGDTLKYPILNVLSYWMVKILQECNA